MKITKTEEDCTMDGDTIKVRLEQGDTLALDSSAFVDIQLRVLTLAGDALASQVFRVPIRTCLDDEVIE